MTLPMPAIDIQPEHWDIVRNILHTHVPQYAVWAFGSRATGKAKKYSDLDLAVISDKPLSLDIIASLHDDFSESDLPYKVDVVDWATTSESFRKIIERDKVVVQGGIQTTQTEDWLETPLGNVFTVTHGFAFKGEFFTDTPQKTILVTPGNFKIGGGFQDNKRKYYNGPVPKEYILKPNQIIVTMTDLSKEADTLGYAAVIPNDSNIWLHNQRIGLLKFNPSVPASPKFIQYLLRSHEYRSWIIGSATGTTVKHTSPSRIESYVTKLPPLPVQQRIADILGALDDKIELNRRMNATLEAMARALFKSWFVDFDPVHAKAAGQPTGLPAHIDALFPSAFVDSPLGQIPQGWGVGRLIEHIEVLRGFSYKGEGLSDSTTGIPMHNLNSIYEGGGYKYEGVKYYSGKFQDKYLIKSGDLIVTNTEQGFDHMLIGHAAIIPEKYQIGIFSHHIYKVSPLSNSPFTTHYLEQFLNLPHIHDYISGFSNGTTINMLPVDALQLPQILIPNFHLISYISEFLKINRMKYEQNIDGITTLTALRDTLLPKLISGGQLTIDIDTF